MGVSDRACLLRAMGSAASTDPTSLGAASLYRDQVDANVTGTFSCQTARTVPRCLRKHSTSGSSRTGRSVRMAAVGQVRGARIGGQHGIAVPTTWDEYLAAAQKLHAADPKAYITSDTGDAGFTTSMIWQAGGKPYTVDGTTVGVDFGDAGTNRYTALWQKLIDGTLLSPVPGWSDAWYKGLGDGTIATLVTGAWMPANLESSVKATAGKWRVAPMPQWEAGGTATSENGGSSLAMPAAGGNKKLAWAFMKYATVDAGAQTRTDQGAFPATTAQLNSAAFRDRELPYFGGQKVNQVLADAATQVIPGWSYLPFQVYANSIFGDT
ncbi:MAG: extracellular solute-binding protein, partial [Micromonosporaceae bacterium]|nr:extracellular solute-binding protein [Micromonosporaceae bacterium]